MAKTKRGKGLLGLPSRGRGTCPVCLSTRIKVLYTVTNSEGKQIQVCKRCSSAPQSKIDKAITTGTIAFRRRLRKTLNELKAKQSATD